MKLENLSSLLPKPQLGKNIELCRKDDVMMEINI